MDLTVGQLKAKLEAGDSLVLIDVREPYEHEAFHIGGQLIPLGQLAENIPALSAHQTDHIVLYCRSGSRSGMAAHLLRAAGFSHVSNLVGGMLAWEDQYGTR
ncbi:MAG: hypothetical protein RLY31_2704 [Bacteroidota bacterium]|jgi:rhodanese-related sulfurtransferase